MRMRLWRQGYPRLHGERNFPRESVRAGCPALGENRQHKTFERPIMTNNQHGQVPEALIDLIDAYAETRHRCGGIYNARTEAARKAVIEALSGVQALSAAPEAIAKLRHLYQNMVNGAVRDTASAKRIAEGLLAPAIAAFERATPPAAQATTTEAVTTKAGVTTGAALGDVYAELLEPDATTYGLGAVWNRHSMRGFADRTHALRMEQAAPKAAPVKACVCGEPQAPGTVHRVDGPCYVAAPQQAATKAAPGEPFDECFPGEPRVAVPQGLISAACFAIRNKRDGGKVLEQLRRYSVGDLSQPLAPQQEAQEPCGWAVYDSLGFYELHDTEAEAKSFCDHYNKRPIDPKKPYTYRAHFTAPQPAPAPLSDDTKRLAWMADGWTPGHEKIYTQHVLESGGVGDLDDLRTFIDKQIAAQGGKA